MQAFRARGGIEGRCSQKHHQRTQPAGGVQIPAVESPSFCWLKQTVGGYAKIATVVSSDLDALAQARPGETVHFEKVDLEQARKLFMENRKEWRTPDRFYRVEAVVIRALQSGAVRGIWPVAAFRPWPRPPVSFPVGPAGPMPTGRPPRGAKVPRGR